MQVSKWGNSLAVRLPMQVVTALDLKEGDDIEVLVTGEKSFAVRRDEKRKRAFAELQKLRRPLPPGFKFDREEAHVRRRIL